jgi:hypothetical protein
MEKRFFSLLYFLFFVSITTLLIFTNKAVAIEPTLPSYDIYAKDGTINYMPEIDNFYTTNSKLTFIVYQNDSTYNGSATYTLTGSVPLPYGRKTKNYPFTLSIVMDGVKDCWNFGNDRIYCDGKGHLHVSYFGLVKKIVKKLYYNTNLETFRIDVIDGNSVNIAGGKVGNDIFRVTGMNVESFYSGKVAFPMEIYYSDNSNHLKYRENKTANEIVNLENFIFVKNIGTVWNETADIFVCGEDFPGVLKFQIWGDNVKNWQGISPYMGISNTFTMPICPNNFYIGNFGIGQKVEIPFQGFLNYAQLFSQGQLRFDVVS